MSTATATATWTDCCPATALFPGNPVGVRVGSKQIALVRIDPETVYAISNFDPFSQAMVLARGIAGDVRGEPMLASPIYKQRFSLKTGICFDDPTVIIPVYPVRIRDGRIEIAA